MDSRDRMAIEGLFSKLEGVERLGQPRDVQAEAFIRERIKAQPGAPYYMAQTIIVQEQALDAAQERIADLEARLAENGVHEPGVLDGIVGAPRRTSAGFGSVPPIAAGMYREPSESRSTGGFLAGAAQTAMGVAGGLLLATMISGLFRTDGDNGADTSGTMVWDDDRSRFLLEEAGFDDDAGNGGLFDGWDV